MASSARPTPSDRPGPDGPRPASRGPRTEDDPRGPVRPAAAALLAVEALLLVVTATYCFLGVSSGALDGRFGTGLGIFLLVFAAGVAVAARSLLHRGRFGLGFGVTWQLFQALVGASLLRGAMYWQGALALLLAIAAFALLLSLVRSTPLPRDQD